VLPFAASRDVLGVDQATVNRDLDPNGSEAEDQFTDFIDKGPDGDPNGSDDLDQSRKREAAVREQLRIAQTPIDVPNKRYGTIV